MRDTLWSGKTFRTFNAVDDYNREALAVEGGTSLPAGRVVRVLDRFAGERGHCPEKLRMDNGPEFIGSTLAAWDEAHGVNLEFSQPGKPTQNFYVERFNRTYRTEVLDPIRVQQSGGGTRSHREVPPRAERRAAPRVPWGICRRQSAPPGGQDIPCPPATPNTSNPESLLLSGPTTGDFTRPMWIHLIRDPSLKQSSSTDVHSSTKRRMNAVCESVNCDSVIRKFVGTGLLKRQREFFQIEWPKFWKSGQYATEGSERNRGEDRLGGREAEGFV